MDLVEDPMARSVVRAHSNIKLPQGIMGNSEKNWCHWQYSSLLALDYGPPEFSQRKEITLLKTHATDLAI